MCFTYTHKRYQCGHTRGPYQELVKPCTKIYHEIFAESKENNTDSDNTPVTPGSPCTTIQSFGLAQPLQRPRKCGRCSMAWLAAVDEAWEAATEECWDLVRDHYRQGAELERNEALDKAMKEGKGEYEVFGKLQEEVFIPGVLAAMCRI